MSLWAKIKTAALTDVAVLVRGFDHDALERLEKILLEADFGSQTFEIVEQLEAAFRKGAIKTESDFHDWMIDKVSGLFLSHASPPAGSLELGGGGNPGVILFVGVNGVGKTTQVAKVAHRLKGLGKDVLLVAADTFRAGAAEQLSVWAGRLDVEIVSGTPNADPASVVFDGLRAGRSRGKDAILIDTAGRLHTEGNLMAELEKIVRVIKKSDEDAPHETLLVIDGTVGQNALQQAKAFAKAAPPTGIIVTKLDGTAKGGAVAALPREIGVPVRFVGVGERVEDLENFEAHAFAERLLAEK